MFCSLKTIQVIFLTSRFGFIWNWSCLPLQLLHAECEHRGAFPQTTSILKTQGRTATVPALILIKMKFSLSRGWFCTDYIVQVFVCTSPRKIFFVCLVNWLIGKRITKTYCASHHSCMELYNTAQFRCLCAQLVKRFCHLQFVPSHFIPALKTTKYFVTSKRALWHQQTVGAAFHQNCKKKKMK